MNRNIFELMQPKIYEELIRIDEWLNIFGMPVSGESKFLEDTFLMSEIIKKMTIDEFRNILVKFFTILGYSAVDILELPNSNSFNITFNKRPGERFWVVGIPLVPLGFSIARWHEAERWRVGVVLEGAGDNDEGRGFLGVEGAWLPSTGAISPYLGGGLGIVGAGEEEGAGLKLEVGVELLRHHRVRLMLGADAVIPFFRTGKGVYPALVIRCAL